VPIRFLYDAFLSQHQPTPTSEGCHVHIIFRRITYPHGTLGITIIYYITGHVVVGGGGPLRTGDDTVNL